MLQDQPHLECQNIDERAIVEVMMCDEYSEYWEKCHQFVSRCVYARANNIPQHLWDDMAQDIMIKIMKYLPQFRFECSLKTWLNTIIGRHIIDEYRKQQSLGPHLSFSTSPPGEIDGESPEFGTSKIGSIEDDAEKREKIRTGMKALEEYANTTSHPIRNWHIIWLVLFDGQTHAEAAKATGCNPPVVGHVVREAQRYARDKMK